jgi:hypothetical protein
MRLDVGFSESQLRDNRLSFVIWKTAPCFKLFAEKRIKKITCSKEYLFLEALEGHLNQYGDICNVSQVAAYD